MVTSDQSGYGFCRNGQAIRQEIVKLEFLDGDASTGFGWSFHLQLPQTFSSLTHFFLW